MPEYDSIRRYSISKKDGCEVMVTQDIHTTFNDHPSLKYRVELVSDPEKIYWSTLTRKFGDYIDLSQYKTLNFWLDAHGYVCNFRLDFDSN